MGVWKVWLKCPFCGGYVNRKRSPLTPGKYPLVVRQFIGGRGIAKTPIAVADKDVVADSSLSSYANQILDFIGIMCERLEYEYPPPYVKEARIEAEYARKEEEKQLKKDVKAAKKAQREQKAAIRKAAKESEEARKAARKEAREEARQQAAIARKPAKQKEAEEKKTAKQREKEEGKKPPKAHQASKKKAKSKPSSKKAAPVLVNNLLDELGSVSIPIRLVETAVGSAKVGPISTGKTLNPFREDNDDK